MPMGASVAMMDQSREGRELWRISQMSTHDLLCNYFEHDKVRMHFARIAGENLVSPGREGDRHSACSCSSVSSKRTAFGVPVGGSGKLTDALIACIRDQRRRSAGRAWMWTRCIVAQRPRDRSAHQGRPRVCRQGCRHRRDPSAPARRNGGGDRSGGGARSGGNGDLLQSPASPFTPHSRRRCEVSAGEPRRCGDDRAAAERVRAAAALVR